MKKQICYIKIKYLSFWIIKFFYCFFNSCEKDIDKAIIMFEKAIKAGKKSLAQKFSKKKNTSNECMRQCLI
jgi:hypothetical protein